jgi:hypothetical protein
MTTQRNLTPLRVNSGERFEPNATVPVPAGGSFAASRAPGTMDGVKKGEKEPVVIGLIGQGPVDIKLAEPAKPPWREV